MAPSPVILAVAVFFQAATMAGTALALSLPGCLSTCGSMVIPYPFGVGAGCHLAGFGVTCNRSYHPPKLFLGGDAAATAEVLEISLLNSTVIVNSAVRYAADEGEGAWGRGLAGAFCLRERRNRLAVVGCNLQAVLLDDDAGRDNVAACTTICGARPAADGELADSCSGVGCCQASIYLGLTSYSVRLSPFGTSTGPTTASSSSNQSALVFIADNEWFGGDASKLGAAPRPVGGGRVDGDMPVAPAVLDWAIGKSGCPPHGSDDTTCRSSNSYCRNSTSTSHGGYSCQCDNAYRGNPYVANGCQEREQMGSQSCCHVKAIFNRMKPKCLQEEQQHKKISTVKAEVRQNTLQDILYSPQSFQGEAIGAPSPRRHSPKVCPINPDRSYENNSPNIQDSFSIDRISIRSQNSIRRVSFRLPDESDISIIPARKDPVSYSTDDESVENVSEEDIDARRIRYAITRY